ncbi:MAG: hypothetical protein K2X66_17590 [Cyanobacteria bacterium]|nr:hypothetical protein [Cyanobacteriota bacterium]
MTGATPENQPIPQKSGSKKVLWITLGCVGVFIVGIIALFLLGIIAALVIPKIMNQSYQEEATLAKTKLKELKSAAALYSKNQGHPPNNFLDFVSNGPLSSDAQYTINIQTFAARCEIQDTEITCPGGDPGTAFPKLPGNVIYFFESNSESFHLECTSGPKAPMNWDPPTCGVQPGE